MKKWGIALFHDHLIFGNVRYLELSQINLFATVSKSESEIPFALCFSNHIPFNVLFQIQTTFIPQHYKVSCNYIDGIKTGKIAFGSHYVRRMTTQGVDKIQK